MTRREVIQSMGLVSATWSNWRLPEGEDQASKDQRELMVRAWLRVLAPFDNASVVAAIDSFVVEAGAFAPHQGMIARRAAELEQRASGQALPDVDEAWARVQSQIARVGWTGDLDPARKPQLGHVAIEAAVKAMGGWRVLCESETPMADRAHFVKLYGSVVARAERETLVPDSVRALAERLGPKSLEAAP